MSKIYFCEKKNHIHHKISFQKEDDRACRRNNPGLSKALLQVRWVDLSRITKINICNEKIKSYLSSVIICLGNNHCSQGKTNAFVMWNFHVRKSSGDSGPPSHRLRSYFSWEICVMRNCQEKFAGLWPSVAASLKREETFNSAKQDTGRKSFRSVF